MTAPTFLWCIRSIVGEKQYDKRRMSKFKVLKSTRMTSTSGEKSVYDGHLRGFVNGSDATTDAV